MEGRVTPERVILNATSARTASDLALIRPGIVTSAHRPRGHDDAPQVDLEPHRAARRRAVDPAPGRLAGAVAAATTGYGWAVSIHADSER